MNLDNSISVPLWLLYEDEIEAWRAGATRRSRASGWPSKTSKAEKHRVLLLPDSAGTLAAAVGGLGKRQGELSLWHAAGIAERLPRASIQTRTGIFRRGSHATIPGIRLRRHTVLIATGRRRTMRPPSMGR